MYAVMRFGKSFTFRCWVIELDAKIVFILSAKNDVSEEWKKTIEGYIKFDGFSFLNSNSILQNETITKEKIEAGEKIALFLTLQYLYGGLIKTKHKKYLRMKLTYC